MEVYEIAIEELLRHDRWLRRMVADLVEPDLVDDVVQETFLAAWLQGRSQNFANLPGFLRRVGRNLALKHRRGEARRRRREQAVALPEPLPSTAELLERLQAHRQLTTEVMQLAEPYRTAVLLRYFEDLTPAEIARRQGVPASTVRTRLERGLQQLHGRLDRGAARSLALVFLLPGSRSAANKAATLKAATLKAATVKTGAKAVGGGGRWAATLFSGAVFVTIHLKFVLFASVGILLLALGFWPDGVSGAEPAHRSADGGTLAGDARGSAPPSVATHEPPAAEARQGLPPARAKIELSGRVLDRTGLPLAGVALSVLAHQDSVVTSDPLARTIPRSGAKCGSAVSAHDGSFTCANLSLPTGTQSVSLMPSEQFVVLRAMVPAITDLGATRALVIAAPACLVQGTVVDSDEKPVAGVMIAAKVDGLSAFPEPLDGAASYTLAYAVSDAEGAFVLQRAPRVPELELLAAPPSSAALMQAVARDIVPEALVRIRLRKNRGRGHSIFGRVVDNDRFVAGALVIVGGSQTRSDGEGRFKLHARQLPDDAHLLVAKAGRQTRLFPETLAALRQQHDVRGAVLQLGAPALQLAGTVVDQDGKPLANLPVQLVDPTMIDTMQSAEDYARGVTAKVDTISSARGRPTKVDATTAADGSFVVAGLSGRPYRLRVYVPETFANVVVGPLQPVGGTHRIVLRTDMIEARVQGVVRDHRDQPLAGVRVAVNFKTYDGGTMTMWGVGDSTKTDAEGRFTLKNVPRQGAHLSVRGDKIVDLKHALDLEAVPPSMVVLQPWMRCHFRLELVAADGIDQVAVVDKDNRALQLGRISGQMSFVGDVWSVESGKTPVLSVGENGDQVVLKANGKEMRRLPFRLLPGQIVVVR